MPRNNGNNFISAILRIGGEVEAIDIGADETNEDMVVLRQRKGESEDDSWKKHPVIKKWLAGKKSEEDCPFPSCKTKMLSKINLYNARLHFINKHSDELLSTADISTSACVSTAGIGTSACVSTAGIGISELANKRGPLDILFNKHNEKRLRESQIELYPPVTQSVSFPPHKCYEAFVYSL